jgi:uncharacterized protein
MEKRFVSEIRAAADRKLVGYAATFGIETRIGSMVEVIQPGAFKDSLTPGKDILCLADHDASRVLGRTRSGTLRLSEDSRGLFFELHVPDTAAGRDMLTLAERGDLGGMSFGFFCPPDGEIRDGNRRTLTKVDLLEISIVSSWPAYQGTSVEARSKALRSKITRFLETIT